MENAKKSSPLLYGLFFEDINHGLDGGLNADLIQNGFFDFCYFNYNSIDLQKSGLCTKTIRFRLKLSLKMEMGTPFFKIWVMKSRIMKIFFFFEAQKRNVRFSIPPTTILRLNAFLNMKTAKNPNLSNFF